MERFAYTVMDWCCTDLLPGCTCGTVLYSILLGECTRIRLPKCVVALSCSFLVVCQLILQKLPRVEQVLPCCCTARDWLPLLYALCQLAVWCCCCCCAKDPVWLIFPTIQAMDFWSCFFSPKVQYYYLYDERGLVFFLVVIFLSTKFSLEICLGEKWCRVNEDVKRGGWEFKELIEIHKWMFSLKMV